ncbi:MAG: hypothetical protein V1672_04375 [Candidatus Diapherotrites archaeon]
MPKPREPIHKRFAKAIAHPFNSLILGPDWEEKLKARSGRKKKKMSV